jgi:Flp pilus assembly protein TadG
MRKSRIRRRRDGKILVMAGLLMIMLLGLVALAVDIGWILVTRTQLQAASDSGSLAAGTELISGLGVSRWRTPAEVQAAAEPVAVQFVAEHVAGEANSAHIDPARDMRFGKATFNGTWNFQWGATPYNAVGVTTQRSSVGSNAGDGPLPLVFGRVLGHNFSDVTVESAAVIMPASGIRIPPEADFTSALSPFAFSRARWQKYQRARDHFEAPAPDGFNKDVSLIDEANDGHLVMDPESLDGAGNPILDANGNPDPLYYEYVQTGASGNFELRRIFDDRYRVINPEKHNPENIVPETDGVLEANIYPLASEDGNFGTVDIGGLDNSTQVIKRQITSGVSAEDMALYEKNMLNPSEASPVQLQGDTGISSGIEASLEDIIGDCRTIVLYSDVVNPGNTAMYTIVDMVGIRVMAVDLSGGNKVLVIQPCSVSDPAGIHDYDQDIGDDTTVFTPLILAR